eukprot:COSAG04_NODE_981_length_9013_cov_4.862928_3_plen_38_part_00
MTILLAELEHIIPRLEVLRHFHEVDHDDVRDDEVVVL